MVALPMFLLMLILVPMMLSSSLLLLAVVGIIGEVYNACCGVMLWTQDWLTPLIFFLSCCC